MLRNGDKDTGGKSHVEDPVSLLAVLLNISNSIVELLEGLVLIVLTRDICADRSELFELFFHLFRRGLDVRLDSFEVLGMVHLRSSISDNLDVIGEELVAELDMLVSIKPRNVWEAGRHCLQGQKGQGKSSSLRDRRMHRGQQSRCFP